MTDKIRVCKEFRFEAAHALDGYEGKCKDIHGHSYHLKITVIGIPDQDPDHPNCGMVIDFSEIKTIVKSKIIPLFDHRLLLREDSRFKGIEDTNERVRFLEYQPTCENMLLEIVKILKSEFIKDVGLHSVFLRETDTSYTEWFSQDHQ